MEVSKETLEAAAHSMLQGTPSQQQEAVQFFETWQNSNNVLITASRIFLSALTSINQNPNIHDNNFTDSLRFIICCVILEVSSSDSWYKYDRESKNEIRENVLNISYNFSHARNVSEKLDQIVANIAFNEWPENWPDFLPMIKNFLDTHIDIKSNQNIFSENSMHVYRTLFYFLKLISGSTKITLARRSQLLNFFIQNLPNFFNSIFTENSINLNLNNINTNLISSQNAYISLESFLEFTSQLFLVIQSDQNITATLSQFLFTTFIEIPSSLIKLYQNTENSSINPNIQQNVINLEKLSATAFNNLSLLLSKSSYLMHLTMPIINLFESINKASGNEQFQSNRFNSSFCEFVCNFLLNIIKPIFDSISIENSPNQNIIAINADNAAQFQELLNLTLVLAPRDHFCDCFWILWNTILAQIAVIGNSNNKPSLEIFKQIVTSLLPLILTSFYETLPCSTILSRLSSPLVASSLANLSKIVPQETITFISSQSPSLSLCYSLGILKNQMLLPKLIESVEYIKNILQSQMPDILTISGILYALSRNAQLIINSSIPDREQLVQILIEFFKKISCNLLLQSDDPDYQETLLLALNHMSTNAPEIFTKDMQFVDILLEVASDPIRIGKDNFSRLCSIIAKVILTTPPQVKDSYIERLTSIASVPLVSTDLNAIVVGTQAAYSIASIAILGQHYITQFLWKPLIAALKTTSVVSDHFLFSDIVSVFASSIRSAPYPKCRKYISQFMEISLQTLSAVKNDENKNKESQPMSEPLNPVSSIFDDLNLTVSVLDAYNMMHQMFREPLDDYRDLFANTFAQTMANNPTSTFFEFFEINDVKENEERPVVECACASLQNPCSKITKAAASLLKKMISRRKDDQFITLWQPKIIHSVFLSLFDQLHNEPIVLVSVINVIYAIYKRHIRNSSLSPSLDQIVVDAICESVGDANVSLHIAESLRFVANSKEEFIQLIKDFLGTYGRMNPVEMKMFDESLSSLSNKSKQDPSSLLPSSNSSNDIVDIRNFSQVHY